MREFTLVDERVASLHLWVWERGLTVVCIYVQNSTSEYTPCLESLEQVLESTPKGLHCPTRRRQRNMDNDSEIWTRDVIERNGLPDPNPSGIQLLDFCASHSLSITNNMFSHKSVHKCTWHQDTLGRQLMTL